MKMAQPIRGSPNYSIDESGNVFNKDKKKLKPQKNHKGYLRVYLYDDSHVRKCFLIHRLVAQTFIPNPNNLPEVNHKDTNKENNCVSNLEWVSGSENIKHAIEKGVHFIPTARGEDSTNHKLTWEQVNFIRKHYKFRDKKYNSVQLAKMFNVRPETVRAVINGTNWKEKKYACDIRRL